VAENKPQVTCPFGRGHQTPRSWRPRLLRGTGSGLRQSARAFLALLQRHCQLGQQLPKEDDFDPDDEAERARVQVILNEMSNVQSEIDAMMNWH
jgi:hypothetical protein